MANFKQGALVERITSTATAGGTTTLTNSSTTVQIFTGTLAQTVQLPNGTTMSTGQRFDIINQSTGVLTIKANDTTTTVTTIAASSNKTLRLTDNSTSNGTFYATVLSSSAGGVTTIDVQSLRSGQAGSNSALSRKITFNPEEIGGDFWLTRGSLGTGKTVGAVFTLNGYMYAPGGSAGAINERFDDANNYWLVRTSISNNRTSMTGFIMNGFGYYTGGSATNTGEKYNDLTNAWSTIATYPITIDQSMGFNLNGVGYSCGGFSGSSKNNHYQYDDVGNAWYTRGSMITPRYGHTTYTLNGFGHAIAGNNGSDIALAEKFNDSTDTWSSIASRLNALSNTTGFSNNGFGFAVGGSAASKIVEQFTDYANAWIQRTSTINGRQSAGGENVNSAGYIFASSTSTAIVEGYKNSTLLNFGLFQKTTATPASVYAYVKMGTLATNVPVQVRSDGDNWKYLTGNSDSSLRVSETLGPKFQQKPLFNVMGGDNGSNTSTTANEQYNDVANSWSTRTAMTTAKSTQACFSIDGLSYHVAGLGAAALTGSPVATNYRYDDAADTWTTKTAYTIPLYFGQGFTIIGFGYVAGGENNSSSSTAAITTANKYNATLDSWSSITALNTAEEEMGSYALLDRGYIVGGTTGGGASASTANQQYNSFSNAWVSKATTSVSGRYSSAFSLNGYGYSGCSNGSAQGVQKYDQQADSWATAGSTNSVHQHGGAGAWNGYGYFYCQDPNAVVEQFNDSFNTFTTKTSMNTSRAHPSKGAGPGAYHNYEVRVAIPSFIAGLGASTWIARTNLNTAKRTYSGFVLGGKGYMPRGFFGGSETAQMERHDLELNTWTRNTDAPAAAYEQASASVLGYGFTVGGVSGGTGSTGNYRYDPETQSWTTRTAYSTASIGVRASTLNGFMYRMGGSDNSSNVLSTVELFDDNANSWTAKASMTTLKRYPNPFNKGGFIYVAGGQSTTSDASNLTSTEFYNDAANTWTSGAGTLAQGKRGCGSANSNAFALIVGGNDTSGNAISQVESYSTELRAWILKTSLPTANSAGPGLICVADRFIQAGGNTGSDTAVTQEFVTSKNSIVVGVSLDVQ